MGADNSTSSGQDGPGGPGQAGTPPGGQQAASGQQAAAGGQPDSDRLDRIEATVDQLAATLHGGSQRAVQDRLDAPGATADEVRRQIEARDRERAATEAAAAKDGRIKALEDKIAGMAEQAPEPPVRRVERFMGWRS